MGFEREELRQIRKELERAINSHQLMLKEPYNELDKYVFTVGNCSYTDSKATFKLEVTIKGAKSEERVALEKSADYFGIDLEKDHPEWKLVGYNRKARGYPILMEKKSNGKTYKFKLESVKQMFKKEVA